MKKLIQFACVALIAMLFTSCKKDYTCTCVYHYPGDPDETTMVTVHSTKSKATTFCSNLQSTFSMGGFDPGESYTCHL